MGSEDKGLLDIRRFRGPRHEDAVGIIPLGDKAISLVHVADDPLARNEYHQRLGDEIEGLVAGLAGDPDSSVLGHGELAGDDREVGPIQLPWVVQFVGVEGGNGKSGQVGGHSLSLGERLADGLFDAFALLESEGFAARRGQVLGEGFPRVGVGDGLENEVGHPVASSRVPPYSRQDLFFTVHGACLLIYFVILPHHIKRLLGESR